MRFLSAAHTDTGISKKINQDAFTLKTASASGHNIAFAVLCDGMGGLKQGELASAFVINAFSGWFVNEFSRLAVSGRFDFEAIKKRWNDIIQDQGKKILSYGQHNSISLGTTLTVLLCVDNNFIFAQVGDSRIYRINSAFSQITRDHTVVAFELENKRITPEQAKTDSRKNILLQCIGASKTIVPDFGTGTFSPGEAFLLCSDGFRHEINDNEFMGVLSTELLTSERVMKKSLIDLVELNKSRGEKDNITALLIKGIE